MAAEGMPFPWRWDDGMISTNLDCIWGMSVEGRWLSNFEKEGGDGAKSLKYLIKGKTIGCEG